MITLILLTIITILLVIILAIGTVSLPVLLITAGLIFLDVLTFRLIFKKKK